MKGHVRRRKGKRGTSWSAVVYTGRDAEGNPRYKWHGGYRTRDAAERELRKLIDRLEDGSYVEPKRTTVAEWLREWLPVAKRELRPATTPSYEIAVEKHLIPRIGSLPLQKLTSRHLNAMYGELLEEGRCRPTVSKKDPEAALRRGLSPSTVRSIHRVLNAALKAAVEEGLLATNPAAKAKPPRAKVIDADALKARSFLDADQLRTFLLAVREHRLRAAFHLAATTGMRRGELLGLRGSDVDLEEGRLVVAQTLLAPRYELTFSEPKTKQGRRSIDLDSETVAVLRAHRRRQAEERLAFGPGYDDGHDLVFRKESGKPLVPHLFTLAFQKAVKDAGLPPIRLHDLRHTHVALLAKAGVPAKVIQERLGHSNVAFTLSAYGGVFPAQHREAAEKFASLVAGGAEEEDWTQVQPLRPGAADGGSAATGGADGT